MLTCNKYTRIPIHSVIAAKRRTDTRTGNKVTRINNVKTQQTFNYNCPTNCLTICSYMNYTNMFKTSTMKSLYLTQT